MRKYPDDFERRIRVKRQVDNWRRSGLLDNAQHARVGSELEVDLRRTNRYLRATLLGFGLLIIAAAIGLVAVTLEINSQRATGVLFVLGATVCAVLAELLTERFRLYCFGIEEACAIGAVLLGAGGSTLVFSDFRSSTGLFDSPMLIGLASGATLAAAVYCRFGLIYAALAAIGCAGFLPFQIHMPESGQRLLAAGIFGGCAFAAGVKRRQYDDEFPGEDYGNLRAASWIAVYAVLNLHLGLSVSGDADQSWFKWFTYVMIGIVPAAALWLSIRDRDRTLLAASLAMAVATLVTSKPYLGMARKPWDPMLLGALLIGGAMLVRRWLATGDGGSRRGFTATRILRSDDDALAAAGIISGVVGHGAAHRHSDPLAPDGFQDGRSGGAGGGASF